MTTCHWCRRRPRSPPPRTIWSRVYTNTTCRRSGWRGRRVCLRRSTGIIWGANRGSAGLQKEKFFLLILLDLAVSWIARHHNRHHLVIKLVIRGSDYESDGNPGRRISAAGSGVLGGDGADGAAAGGVEGADPPGGVATACGAGWNHARP